MEIMNGFIIIAIRPVDEGEVVLGVRKVPASGSNALVEYVTAHRDGPNATSWYSGHYFYDNFQSALNDYRAR